MIESLVCPNCNSKVEQYTYERIFYKYSCGMCVVYKIDNYKNHYAFNLAFSKNNESLFYYFINDGYYIGASKGYNYTHMLKTDEQTYASLIDSKEYYICDFLPLDPNNILESLLSNFNSIRKLYLFK